ncbi:IS256 family transposase [Candidatus Formimonas warabiya]|uniref:Mutator family transposase n=2 Tax=Formimonas warabiya TaxID=1761012 RepID=A0A3G1L0H5_FORW1|nr:IS256 family transposase [Candidatus Formimonas warabiya]ATW28422.1 IS256 family transposase [Candidatus Formimonas warabiya]
MLSMNERANELVKLLAQECSSMEDIHTMLKNLFSGTIEQMLEAEMDEHLGYDKHSPAGDLSGNSRNGYNQKTIQTQMGKTEIKVPRDRNGEFEPQLIEKYQTKSNNLEQQVIAMYQKGMSTRDIEAHLRDIYGVDASPALISRITDKIMPQLMEWQSRPLESIYPVTFFDGIVFKVRKDAKIINKCAYTVLGINMEGRKEILGIWISENESASFWATVVNEMKNRGINDIFIACHDNLNGLSTAINSVFPKTEQQLCIIHQIRNSTKYVSYKDLKPIMADLKTVYQAPCEEDALYHLEEFGEKWGKKYPQIAKSWRDNWSELSVYFKYPENVRRLIYTTNAVEGFHRMLRKFTKTKTTFPGDEALKKSVYLSIMEIEKKWGLPMRDWGIIMGQMSIFFEERLSGNKSA